MSNTPIKTVAAAFALATMCLTTAACNTVKGLGEDVESVGEAGERAID